MLPISATAQRCYTGSLNPTEVPCTGTALLGGFCYSGGVNPVLITCPVTLAEPAESSDAAGGAVTINNPLPDITLMGFFISILEILLVFAVPLIVFFIIFAGFKYVMAQGKPEEIKTASRALLYAIIGGLIILGAWIILAVIEGTVAAFIT